MSELAKMQATLEYIQMRVDEIKERMDERDRDCKVHTERTIKIESEIAGHRRSISGIVGGIFALLTLFIGGMIAVFFKV